MVWSIVNAPDTGSTDIVTGRPVPGYLRRVRIEQAGAVGGIHQIPEAVAEVK